jgi:hypothetical protein
MGTGVLFAAIAGCLTPRWPDDAIAPRGEAPWSHPSDDACLAQADLDAFEVDGFLFCGAAAGTNKIPVDDPVYAPCDAGRLGANEAVLSVFDGAHAQGYRIASLLGREIVHADWLGEPILVDF